MIISGLDLLIEACDQRAQHPAVVVQPSGAEVNGKKYVKKLNLYFKKRWDKRDNSYASIFFYYVLIKYKNNFTLLPDNLLREKKIVWWKKIFGQKRIVQDKKK